MTAQHTSKNEFHAMIETGAVLLVLLGLYIVSFRNYLLFHSLVEFFSIVVASSIFVVAWNSRQFLNNNYLVFLGIAFLFVGLLDLLHLLTYKGVGILPHLGADVPTQLWVAARYVQSISLLLSALFLERRKNPYLVFFGYLVVFNLIVASIFFWHVFPSCYSESGGLTTFKKVSEYIVCGILGLSIVLYLRKRETVGRTTSNVIVLSLVFMILAELSFTFYISVYGFSNFLGHAFKTISFYLMYQAIVVIGLRRPYALLFLDLKRKEQTLQREKAHLEEALAEVRTLSGLLPICASCKKIRDDTGYWNQLETYISVHTDAVFSHGLCPDCARTLYPEIMNPETKKEVQAGERSSGPHE